MQRTVAGYHSFTAVISGASQLAASSPLHEYGEHITEVTVWQHEKSKKLGKAC